MVVIDATIFLLMIRPNTPVASRQRGEAVDHVPERIEYLIKQLEMSRTKVIIPTPALSESLVRVGISESQEIIERLHKSSVFSIEPFDDRAAIELAVMTREAIAKRMKKGDSQATWAKLKFDRQIVAISKVCGATAIYSDDRDIRSLGKQSGMEVIGLADLPLPPIDPQMSINFTSTSGSKPQP